MKKDIGSEIIASLIVSAIGAGVAVLGRIIKNKIKPPKPGDQLVSEMTVDEFKNLMKETLEESE